MGPSRACFAVTAVKVPDVQGNVPFVKPEGEDVGLPYSDAVFVRNGVQPNSKETCCESLCGAPHRDPIQLLRDAKSKDVMEQILGKYIEKVNQSDEHRAKEKWVVGYLKLPGPSCEPFDFLRCCLGRYAECLPLFVCPRAMLCCLSHITGLWVGATGVL